MNSNCALLFLLVARKETSNRQDHFQAHSRKLLSSISQPQRSTHWCSPVAWSKHAGRQQQHVIASPAFHIRMTARPSSGAAIPHSYLVPFAQLECLLQRTILRELLNHVILHPYRLLRYISMSENSRHLEPFTSILYDLGCSGLVAILVLTYIS